MIAGNLIKRIEPSNNKYYFTEFKVKLVFKCWIILFTLNWLKTHKHLASSFLSVKMFEKQFSYFSPSALSVAHISAFQNLSQSWHSSMSQETNPSRTQRYSKFLCPNYRNKMTENKFLAERQKDKRESCFEWIFLILLHKLNLN